VGRVYYVDQRYSLARYRPEGASTAWSWTLGTVDSFHYVDQRHRLAVDRRDCFNSLGVVYSWVGQNQGVLLMQSGKFLGWDSEESGGKRGA